MNDQDVDSLVAEELHTLRCKVIAWRRDFNTALIHAADGTRSNAWIIKGGLREQAG